jgi:hypothetical protein
LLAVVGGAFAAVGYFATPAVGDGLDGTSAGFLVRSVVRTGWVTFLALPWCLVARVGSGGWAGVAVGVVVGGVLPAVYAGKLAQEQTAAAQDELAAGRMARAKPLVEGVCDIDPDRRISEVHGTLPMPAARDKLATGLKALTDDVARTRPDLLDPRGRLDYAVALLALDRTAEAEPVLRELADKYPPERVRHARALQQLGRLEESDRAVRALLEEGLPRAAEKANVRAACREAFGVLAENATLRGSAAQREAVLREGLEQLTADEAHFRLQLGRHFKQAGRPVDAARELEQAVHLDPSLAPAASPLLREVREQTPACLIRR